MELIEAWTEFSGMVLVELTWGVVGGVYWWDVGGDYLWDGVTCGL